MEDKVLSDYIKLHGEGKWRDLPEKAGIYLFINAFLCYNILLSWFSKHKEK